MKRLGGLPLSAFVAYSRKRKNLENRLTSKKTKKKRVRLSAVISPNLPDSTMDNKKMAPVKKTLNNKKKKKKCHKPSTLNGNFNGTNVSDAALEPMKASFHSEELDNSATLHVPDVSDVEQDTSSKISETEVHSASPILAQTRSRKKDRSVGKNTKSRTTDRSEESNESLEIFEADVPKCLSNDPMEEGKSLFQWLIHPVSTEDFFKDNWERAPLQIKRSKSSYYKLLMSTPMMDDILRNFHILYSKNIDITSYADGQRETHNPPGRALPSVVWDYYANGCSVRMLNPQTFIPKLQALNATLQEFFGCFVGANSYLTPPDSQGFAPHYDDIEAFILQIEGKKRWRLYKPITKKEYLPRYSSRNFEPSEIGEPILDTVVNAGDLLYFPRGTIHQGETIDGTHSLHITLSVYQKNSWCDFLEKLLPEALRTAVETDSRYREGLPLDYLKYVGYVHSSNGKTESRETFSERTKDLLHRLVDHMDIDKVADQMAKNNIHDFLPPVLSPSEHECSILGDGERIIENGTVENRVEIEPDTRIRLLRSHCIRLVEEEDCFRIYYSTENSKEYREYEPQFLEVERELVPAVEEIIRRYPDFVRVDDLPISGEDNKVQVARDLWEKCIVVTDLPLPVVD